MIFKTIDDDSTLSGQRIVSTFEARKIAQDKLTASLKEQSAQLEIDRQELSLLEQKVKSGMTYEQAYAESIKKASAAAKEHAVSTKGVSGATDTFVTKQKKAQAELEATATSSKVAAVGVKALKLAFNMFSGLAISFAISKIIEGFQYLAESAERAKEKLEDTFIAQKVEEAREVSLEKGQAKYRAYFVRKSAKRLYGRYQDDVDTILTTDGFEDCIVSE